MKEELITFETAKLAKEKGFFYKGLMYRKEGTLSDNRGFLYNLNVYSASTQSILQKWLREKHNIMVTVSIPYEEFGFYAAEIWGENREDGIKILEIDGMSVFKTYEEALEEGLQEALKLI